MSKLTVVTICAFLWALSLAYVNDAAREAVKEEAYREATWFISKANPTGVCAGPRKTAPRPPSSQRETSYLSEQSIPRSDAS